MGRRGALEVYIKGMSMDQNTRQDIMTKYTHSSNYPTMGNP